MYSRTKLISPLVRWQVIILKVLILTSMTKGDTKRSLSNFELQLILLLKILIFNYRYLQVNKIILLTCKSLKISIWMTTLSIPCHSLAARQDDKVSLKSCNIIKPDLIIRAVIKSWGPGIFPGYYGCGPQLLLLENRRNIEPKEFPRWLILCLIDVF